MISNLILILAIALVFALVASLRESSAFWERLRELDPKTWEALAGPRNWRRIFGYSLKEHVRLQEKLHYLAKGEYRKHEDKKLTSIEARQKALLFLVLAIMLLLFMVLLLWAVGPA
jgi:hypothetical protein